MNINRKEFLTGLLAQLVVSPIAAKPAVRNRELELELVGAQFSADLIAHLATFPDVQWPIGTKPDSSLLFHMERLAKAGFETVACTECFVACTECFLVSHSGRGEVYWSRRQPEDYPAGYASVEKTLNQGLYCKFVGCDSRFRRIACDDVKRLDNGDYEPFRAYYPQLFKDFAK